MDDLNLASFGAPWTASTSDSGDDDPEREKTTQNQQKVSRTAAWLPAADCPAVEATRQEGWWPRQGKVRGVSNQISYRPRSQYGSKLRSV